MHNIIIDGWINGEKFSMIGKKFSIKHRVLFIYLHKIWSIKVDGGSCFSSSSSTTMKMLKQFVKWLFSNAGYLKGNHLKTYRHTYPQLPLWQEKNTSDKSGKHWKEKNQI